MTLRISDGSPLPNAAFSSGIHARAKPSDFGRNNGRRSNGHDLPANRRRACVRSPPGSLYRRRYTRGRSIGCPRRLAHAARSDISKIAASRFYARGGRTCRAPPFLKRCRHADQAERRERFARQTSQVMSSGRSVNLSRFADRPQTDREEPFGISEWTFRSTPLPGRLELGAGRCSSTIWTPALSKASNTSAASP